MSFLHTLHLFCKVVDNYGDIGICWRFARQLQREHGIAVTLWVDDLVTFQRICPGLDPDAETQSMDSILIRHWREQDDHFAPAEVADIVIEFFACDIPEGYIEAMAQREPSPVWLNLEGLTAEQWVEGCHSLPSRHPRLPLTKYFFFPGFTDKTGGLLREAELEAQRRRFVADGAAHGFLSSLGMSEQEQQATKVSLFCYPHAPVAALFDAWRDGSGAVTCLVPEGVTREAVEAFFGGPAHVGDQCTQAALTVRILPFLPQPDYDKLLWSCDYNLVRGEDSFVRAQWATHPFVWHIYPQDKNLHHVKLRAFLARYAMGLDALAAFSLAWNDAEAGAADWPALWAALQEEQPKILALAEKWRVKMQEIGDMTSNLLKFAESTASAAQEKRI